MRNQIASGRIVYSEYFRTTIVSDNIPEAYLGIDVYTVFNILC